MHAENSRGISRKSASYGRSFEWKSDDCQKFKRNFKLNMRVICYELKEIWGKFGRFLSLHYSLLQHFSFLDLGYWNWKAQARSPASLSQICGVFTKFFWPAFIIIKTLLLFFFFFFKWRTFWFSDWQISNGLHSNLCTRCSSVNSMVKRQQWAGSISLSMFVKVVIHDVGIRISRMKS